MTDTAQTTPAQALMEAVKNLEKCYPSADAFARELGVDPGFYSRFKRGKQRAGIKLLEALWKKYPQLDGLIKSYIGGVWKQEASDERV